MEESVEINIPTVPDLVQDSPATREQIEVCKRHPQCAMAGIESKLGAEIRSWSNEQSFRSYAQRAHLKQFPSTFSVERPEW
jgi:hypothetical protein